MKNSRFLLLSILLASCTSQLAWRAPSPQDGILDEMRLEIADLKHALNNYQVEQGILEEKINHQQAITSSLKSGGKVSDHLEQRIAQIESLQAKCIQDIRKLSEHAHQTTATLNSCRQAIQECEGRLNEALKIKATLDSISKAVRKPSATYKVKPGDSLDRIARAHQIPLSSLKKWNHLETDHITIGQELKLSEQ